MDRNWNSKYPSPHLLRKQLDTLRTSEFAIPLVDQLLRRIVSHSSENDEALAEVAIWLETFGIATSERLLNDLAALAPLGKENDRFWKLMGLVLKRPEQLNTFQLVYSQTTLSNFARKILEQLPDDRVVLERLIQFASQSRDIELLRELMTRYQARYPLIGNVMPWTSLQTIVDSKSTNAERVP